MEAPTADRARESWSDSALSMMLIVFANGGTCGRHQTGLPEARQHAAKYDGLIFSKGPLNICAACGGVARHPRDQFAPALVQIWTRVGRQPGNTTKD